MSEKNAKVFVIGISRTGTTSLTEALRCIGYQNVIHGPLSIIKRVNGELVLNHEAVRRYDALADTPAAFMFRQLDAAFPGAKFILTVRDVEPWLKSMRRVRRVWPLLRLHPTLAQLVREALGKGGLNDEGAMRVMFLQHIREVLAHFRGRDDLLVMDLAAGDDWEKLCHFLERPIPNVPFPHKNRKTLMTWSNVWDTLRSIA